MPSILTVGQDLSDYFDEEFVFVVPCASFTRHAVENTTEQRPGYDPRMGGGIWATGAAAEEEREALPPRGRRQQNGNGAGLNI